MRPFMLICVLAITLVVVNTVSAASPAKTPTFTRDIAPIIFNNCTSCHREGEIGPFELKTYRDVQKRARLIAETTKDRQMPPWKPEPGFGHFADERRLSDKDIATIQAWVNANTPEGDAKDLPAIPKFTDGWQLGKPDIVLAMKEKFTVPAEGRDVFRCFVLPLEVPEGKYIRAVEYRPGNRKVVHHAILYVDASGRARELEKNARAAGDGPGYSRMGGPGFMPAGGFGGWAPGASPWVLPEGAQVRMKPGSDVVVQTHFHPTGKPEDEQSSIGIYLIDKPPARAMVGTALGDVRININPGDKAYRIEHAMTLPADVEAVGLFPHAHLICKEIKVDATLPDGKVEPLIWIKDWDFNWQGQYRFDKPIKLPAQTKINAVFIYDNSSDNPRNPNSPPKRVRFGEQTTDEMAFVFMQVIPKSLSDIPALMKASRENIVASAFGGGENGEGPIRRAIRERREARDPKNEKHVGTKTD